MREWLAGFGGMPSHTVRRMTDCCTHRWARFPETIWSVSCACDASLPSLFKRSTPLGFGVAKKPGRPRANGNGKSNGSVLKKARKGKVKAKYRDPKTKETWSGRGPMASWLKGKQDAGEKIDTYLV